MFLRDTVCTCNWEPTDFSLTSHSNGIPRNRFQRVTRVVVLAHIADCAHRLLSADCHRA